MKKSILFLALAIFVLKGQINATAVSQQSAQTIALNFFKITVPAAANNPNLALTLSYTQTESNGAVDFYIYNASPMKGFVIVSGDDNATPVIAYSSESNFLTNNAGLTQTGVGDWMKSAAARMHYIVSNNVRADAMIQHLWASYTIAVNPQPTRSSVVGPLCTTIWNQNPYYNALCPPAATASTSSSKAVTGCVATAMAQIMKYWNYPTQGTGTHSYNDATSAGYSQNYGTLSTDFTRVLKWANMPNDITTAPNPNASPVDSLMYELGVGVNMDYSPTGSGAFVLSSESGGGPCAQTVYVNNFYYNPNTIQGVHLSSYNDADWITVMENEINSGRVVQYEGDDATAGGHTWVVDGYDPTATSAAGGAKLHMNWGWGGAYDGYFDITNLSTPGFNPVQNDAALIGIEPIPPFTISLTPANPAICPTSSTTLTASGPAVATYSWTPTTGLSCSTCPSPVANPSSTTLYTVTIDSAGVTATASVAVTVTSAVHAGFSFTPTPTCTLPENVAFANTSTNATGYVWDFGDGSATSTSASPLHSYGTSGTYTVKLFASNSCGVDSMIMSQALQITGGAPTAPSQNICSGQTANITATGSNINWYSDAQGANLMQSGSNVYTTPNLTNTITYYIASVVSPNPVSAGPANDAIGASSVYNQNVLRGMNFNCSVAQTLNSVIVYATGAGPRLFLLEDASGNVLDSATINLIDGQQTVPLGFAVPVGTNLLLAINGVANLTRNSSGAVFPYTSTDGTISITGNNAAAAGRFYYFYDWQFQQAACTTTLTPVSVYVLGTGAGSFSATGTGTPTVNFTPDDLTATSYTWSFGDGNTSTQMTPTHIYATAGTYSVSLVISNGSCSDTITRKINTAITSGINNITALSGLSVYPNPAKDALTLSVNSSIQIENAQLSISNILGQTEFSKEYSLNDGANTMNLNIAGLAPGVYFINLQNGKDVLTTKFVKVGE